MKVSGFYIIWRLLRGGFSCMEELPGTLAVVALTSS
ncbi:hypothetical protein BACOVA_00110 [Bacteroides ovatus ATCC 8483]|uniref:Uncharacterized protein n=1 Tax=Bacteroides ovatus (strain ATCC 8483 / DSM 1896 / JCM 5824 / BCRC 10623 / CCUG 4943 / NCTC 11153) TaxID=411476 RepID=A0AAN3DAV4_BACO1|nr:hypothetical protein BACOVA_00110 [Bacteroides ovatus ATCC 8483]